MAARIIHRTQPTFLSQNHAIFFLSTLREVLSEMAVEGRRRETPLIIRQMCAGVRTYSLHTK